MNIYLVAVWGNYRDDNANGEDTCYLVRATNHTEASQTLLESVYKITPHFVIELGVDALEGGEAEVISLPFIQHAIIHAHKSGRKYPSWVNYDYGTGWESNDETS